MENKKDNTAIKKKVTFQFEIPEDREKFFEPVFIYFSIYFDSGKFSFWINILFCFEAEYGSDKNNVFHTKMCIVRDFMKEIAKTKDEELIQLSKWSKKDLFQKLDNLFATLYISSFQDAYDNIIQFFDEGLFGFCPLLKQQLKEAENLEEYSSNQEDESENDYSFEEEINDEDDYSFEEETNDEI